MAGAFPTATQAVVEGHDTLFRVLSSEGAVFWLGVMDEGAPSHLSISVCPVLVAVS